MPDGIEATERPVGVRINLQLFAEPGEGETTAPAQTLQGLLEGMMADKQAAENPAPPPPVTQETAPAETEPAVPPQTGNQTEETEPAPTMEKRYADLRAHANRQSNKAYLMEKELNEARAKLAELTAAPATAQTATSQTEPEVSPDAFMEKFATDPMGAIKALTETVARQTEERIMARVQPATTYAENQGLLDAWTNEMNAFEESHPDFGNISDKVGEYLRTNNLVHAENKTAALREAYYAAKDSLPPPVATAKPQTFEEMLSDETNLAKIFDNPTIRAKIQTDLVAATRQATANIPRSITDSGGGTAPLVPDRKPTNMAEAGIAMKEWLERRHGN